MPHLSRRQVLQGAATVALFQSLPRSLRADPLHTAPGLELYTVADALAKDLDGTLKQVRAIGYKYVEAARLPGSVTQQQLHDAIQAAGLITPAVHLSFNKEGGYSSLFDDARLLGATYVCSSTLAPEGFKRPKGGKAAGNPNESFTAEDYKLVADHMNHIGKAAKEAGLVYCYHNHDHEFRPLGNGQIGYEILLKNTDPGTVKFEADCGWMMLAGHNPVQYMKDYPDRFRLLHIKDFVKGGMDVSYKTEVASRPAGTELGRGRFDYKPIFAQAAKSGIKYYFVEQEPPFIEGLTSLEAAKIDYEYLHALK